MVTTPECRAAMTHSFDTRRAAQTRGPMVPRLGLEFHYFPSFSMSYTAVGHRTWLFLEDYVDFLARA